VQTTIHTGTCRGGGHHKPAGYTGERGYEIMVDRDRAPWVGRCWGRAASIEPHGVAARGLRTEAIPAERQRHGFETNLHSGTRWTVKLAKDFRQTPRKDVAAGVRRKLVGSRSMVPAPCGMAIPSWDGRRSAA
jgi:glycine cleavage system aminomethyltransferase T